NYAPRRFGLRRDKYPPLPEKLEDVFRILLEFNLVTLPKPHENPPAHWDRTKYYHFHRGPGHNINTCFHFRDLVYDMMIEERSYGPNSRNTSRRTRITNLSLGPRPI